MKVDVHYVIINNGDGSASVIWCKNALEAELYDEWCQHYEGWGEHENFHSTLEFDNQGNMLNTINLRELFTEAIECDYRDSSDIKLAKTLLERLTKETLQ